MAQYKQNSKGGTTDHGEEIAALREWNSIAACAAAGLLEVHDESGISLDDWDDVRDFVVETLKALDREYWDAVGGSAEGPQFLPNGV